MRIHHAVMAAVAVGLFAAQPASATFHLMQVEQVIAGVNGSTGIQAIQLRMRNLGENLVSNARLVVRDASGANPVVLIAFPANVTNGSAGDRVLVATSAFASATVPSLTPDFILTNPIPASYLAAGSLTYEQNTGTVLWRLSWGGAGYTGPGTGAITNDADGNFSPPFAGPLPSSTAQALLFKFAANAASTNNANDYALTAGAATFTNNTRASGTINSLAAVDGGAPENLLALGPPAPNPARNSLAFDVRLPRETRVQLRVIDVFGRVVSTILDETLSGGQHHLSWDAAGQAGPRLSSGMYFLAMDAGGSRRTQRFVLIH